MRAKILAGIVGALLLVIGISSANARQGTPAITIISPREGDTVNFALGVMVSGTAVGVPENNVIVRVYDSTANVVTEQATTAGADGFWQVMVTAVGLQGQGRIQAFSPSPADGSIVAEANVNVTFSSPPGQATNTPPAQIELPIAPTIPPQPTVAPTVPPQVTNTPPVIIMPPIAFTPVPQPTTAPPVEATITITSPQNGATVDVTSGGLTVTGGSTGVGSSYIYVEVVDPGGRILAQQPTTVGLDGSWNMTLFVGAPNTAALIHAYAVSQMNNSILAEASVNVTLTALLPPTPTEPPPVQPASITITNPLDGAIIYNVEQGVRVTGYAFGVPENNVIIQVLDSVGNVLVQAPTTAAADGSWGIIVYIGSVNSPGSIRAFSTSPADGNLVAQDTVNVTLVPTPVVAPYIAINIPVPGSVLDITNGFTASGAAGGLFENGLVVQALDRRGNPIIQTYATVNTTQAGGEGPWSVYMFMYITEDTPGSIYAYSTSPDNGRIAAQALVNVTFLANCAVRTDWYPYEVRPNDTLYGIAAETGSTVPELTVANCLNNPNLINPGQIIYTPNEPQNIPSPEPSITITSPTESGVVDTNNEVTIFGTSNDLHQGLVLVRALDNLGNVLESAVGTANPESPDGQWQVTLPAISPGVFLGTRGVIFAYSISPTDGSIAASAQVGVIYSGNAQTPYVTISNPFAYSTIDISEPFTINGRAAGVVNGQVTVRLSDQNGTVLAESLASTGITDATTEGQWSVDMELAILPGTRGMITVTGVAAGGSPPPVMTVPVVFGDPSNNRQFVFINFPLQDALIDDVRTAYIVGESGGLSGGNLLVQIQSTQGAVLFSVYVASEPGDVWIASFPITQDVLYDVPLVVRAFYAAGDDGQVIAADTIPVVLQGQQ